MSWTRKSKWDGSAWSGPSGLQIGFAGDYPETTGQGFIVDPVHGENVDPNAPGLAARQGDTSNVEIPVSIQEDYPYPYDGGEGWVLDDIPFDSHNADAGVDQDNLPFDWHDTPPGTGYSHDVDIYQISPPPGHSRNFYGRSFGTLDLQAWNHPTTPPSTTGTLPGQAWDDRTPGDMPGHDQPPGTDHEPGWPEPFAAQDIHELRPVILPDEKIPMRRLAEDERPVYSYLAVPARNIMPGGDQWTPSVPSNVPIHNVKPLPAMARTPEDPWVSNTVDYSGGSDTYDVDPLDGML